MKKILITTLIASFMSTLVFADSYETNYEKIEPISISIENTEVPNINELFLIRTAKIRDVEVIDGTYIVTTLSEPNHPRAQYRLTPDSTIYDLSMRELVHPRVLNAEMEIVVVSDFAHMAYDSTIPISYPSLVLVKSGNEDSFFKIDYFNENGFSMDGKLQINLNEKTRIINTLGHFVTYEDVYGNYLAVIYKVTTRGSIPQTSPEAVIMLSDFGPNHNFLEEKEKDKEIIGEKELAPKDNEFYLSDFLKNLSTNNKYEQGYNNFYALRPIATEFGYEINWDAQTQTITLSKENVDILLRIGFLQYKRNDVSHTLDIAPFIRNDMTFVGLEFIENLLK